MKKRCFFLFLIVLAISASGFLPFNVPVQSADESIKLTNVTLWIYPEYDDPRLLVMLEGNLTGISTPTRIRFLVPSTAEMNSAGSKDAQGKYTGGPPDRVPSQIPGWDEISYELQYSTFRMEYYDPIILGDSNKTISYDFKTLYPISSLEIVNQVPKKATNYSAIPLGTKTVEGDYDVYISRYTALALDQTLHFDIRYSKSGKFKALPFLIFGAVIIVIGIIIWVLNSLKKSRRRSKPVNNRNLSGSRKSKPLPSKFCPQCGKRLGLPSKFCPYCRHELGD